MSFAGVSTMMMYIAPMTINMVNFKPKHRGKIVGLTGACWWTGPALFSLMYGTLFSGTQNIRDYFLTCAVIFLVVNIISIFCVKYYPVSLDGTEDHSLEDNTQVDANPIGSVNSEHSTLVSSPTEEAPPDVTGIDLLRSVDFHLIAWCFLLVSSIQIMFINNVSVYLKSYKMDKLITTLTVSGPLVAAMCKFLSGCLSDELLRFLPRASYLAIVTVCQTVLLTACISKGDNMVVFITTTYVVYASNGVYYGLIPTLISEYFGMKYFSRNWGGLILVYALLGWAFLAEFGYVYDHHIPDHDTTTCYGNHCFRESYVIAAATTFIGTLLVLVLMWRERNTVPGRHTPVA